jgi:hypothetical protein
MLSAAAREALDDLIARDDPSILGLVLSGSAARGTATERSDVDVYVVRDDDDIERETLHSPAIDEIYWSVADLEQVDRHGTGGWYFRWSFAYAQVLRDLTGGRITEAVRRQATVDDDEQQWVLIDQDQLDGYLNLAYRALKNHRDGRLLEARLDAGESVSWLLNVMFTLAGWLRPYNKYLPWELRTHPPSMFRNGRRSRSCPNWSGSLQPMQTRYGAPSPSSTARFEPGMSSTTRPSARTWWTRGATNSLSSPSSSATAVVPRC